MAFSDEALARLEPDVAAIIGRYPRPRSALMPLLHLLQSEEGFVSDDAISFCAARLGLTQTEVTAVASFYTLYKRAPVGEYHVGVCTNSLCAIMGGDQILATLEEHLGVVPDEPTSDGKVSLEHVECNAACDYAPVVMVNWEFFDNQTPESAIALVDDLRAGRAVTPTRGPGRLCTWRQASRILAGFADGQAAEGPAAGPASLVGLRIARERGWTAPEPDQPSEPAAPGRPAAPNSPATKGASR
jgi:NADH-quinone oxidoreductase subunit E